MLMQPIRLSGRAADVFNALRDTRDMQARFLILHGHTWESARALDEASRAALQTKWYRVRRRAAALIKSEKTGLTRVYPTSMNTDVETLNHRKSNKMLTASDAREIAARYDIPLDVNFHALRSEIVESIVAAAKERGYKEPKNANGSRARYFHAYLVRAASSK